ncbi:FG-GAP repeat domain-containing protein, partial [Paenibacillus ehimensis]
MKMRLFLSVFILLISIAYPSTLFASEEYKYIHDQSNRLSYIRTASNQIIFFKYDANGNVTNKGLLKPMLGDVNGDKKADAIIFSNGEWRVSLSNGNGFNPYQKWVEGHGVGSQTQMVGDVNGDGKADAIVYFNGEWWVSLSNGNGFNAYKKWVE